MCWWDECKRSGNTLFLCRKTNWYLGFSAINQAHSLLAPRLSLNFNSVHFANSLSHSLSLSVSTLLRRVQNRQIKKVFCMLKRWSLRFKQQANTYDVTCRVLAMFSLSVYFSRSSFFGLSHVQVLNTRAIYYCELFIRVLWWRNTLFFHPRCLFVFCQLYLNSI